MHNRLKHFVSAEALAEAAARHFVQSIPGRVPFHVALSGGRIARAFYNSIVEQLHQPSESSSSESRHSPLVTRPTIDHIHFFFADERSVPPTDLESNFLTARQSLFDPLHLRAEQIHRIHGEAEDTYAAQEAEAELCRIAPLNDDGQPILDLVILGMGEDGHTCSLFPGEPDSLINDKSVYRAVTAVKPPPRRITLGYAPLRVARQLILLASGKGKETALRQVVSEISKNTPTLPLARVLRSNPNFLIFSDIPGSESLAENF